MIQKIQRVTFISVSIFDIDIISINFPYDISVKTKKAAKLFLVMIENEFSDRNVQHMYESNALFVFKNAIGNLA